MNRRSRTVLRLVLAATSAGGFPAAAEDFEIEVPVKVSKLDASFTHGRVSCSVYGSTKNSAPGESRRPESEVYGVIGSGESTFPISRGAYDGPVAVRFPANRLSQPTNARDYSCRLSLVSGGGITQLCVVGLGAKQVSAHALPASKIAASQPCATGRVPLSPKL